VSRVSRRGSRGGAVPADRSAHSAPAGQTCVADASTRARTRSGPVTQAQSVAHPRPQTCESDLTRHPARGTRHPVRSHPSPPRPHGPSASLPWCHGRETTEIPPFDQCGLSRFVLQQRQPASQPAADRGWVQRSPHPLTCREPPNPKGGDLTHIYGVRSPCFACGQASVPWCGALGDRRAKHRSQRAPAQFDGDPARSQGPICRGLLGGRAQPGFDPVR
jgi:hypothetical protein